MTRETGEETPPVWLAAVGHALPERVVTTQEVVDRVHAIDPGWRISARMIERLTGVRERRYADEGVCSSDLATEAAENVLERAGCPRDLIDVLIFAAATHDVAEPATSNRVQALLGCTRARVLDVKNACNSFLDAMDVAAALIQSGRAKRVLITCGEVLSPWISYQRQGGVPDNQLVAGLTLGDAGAAALLCATTEHGALGQIGPVSFLSVGDLWAKSRLMAGGTMHRRDFSESYFVSDSATLFGAAMANVPRVVAKVLGQAEWAPASVDLVVPHQVSSTLTTRLCVAADIDPARAVRTGDTFGNTAAASVPLALSCAIAGRPRGLPERVLLVGGAAGFSAAAVAIHCGTWTGSESQ